MSAYLRWTELRLAPRPRWVTEKPQNCNVLTGLHQARPETHSMSGIMCSQGGYLNSGHVAKAFSSAWTRRHLCRPGNLTSLLSLEAGIIALSLPPDFNRIGSAACASCQQLQTVDLSLSYLFSP